MMACVNRKASLECDLASKHLEASRELFRVHHGEASGQPTGGPAADLGEASKPPSIQLDRTRDRDYKEYMPLHKEMGNGYHLRKGYYTAKDKAVYSHPSGVPNGSNKRPTWLGRVFGPCKILLGAQISHVTEDTTPFLNAYLIG